MENSTKIDESLYSRQLYVLGHDTMRNVMGARVLVIGLRGLGVEVCKNLVLAGVGSLTIFDDGLVEKCDLTKNYYLKEADIGKRVDLSCIQSLNELNPNTIVRTLSKLEMHEEELLKYTTVVVSDRSMDEQLQINKITHKNYVNFISASIYGFFGSVFCDFNKEGGFVVSDITGEDPVAGLICNIVNNKEGIVMCPEDHRHGLESGDSVIISNVKEYPEINGKSFTVRVIDPYSFSIGEISLPISINSGDFLQLTKKKTLEFRSLQECVREPEYVISDHTKADRLKTVHFGFIGISLFRDKFGRCPKAYSEADFEQFFMLLESYLKEIEVDGDLDKETLMVLCYGSSGYVPPMSSIIGGIVAQEVLKSVSGKFHPLVQNFYFDSVESLPTNSRCDENLCRKTGSKYDAQISVLGTDFQKKIENVNLFLVGCGAIGCELLKIWSMMGVGIGGSGHIHITDMDRIEMSNLNRQLLFRQSDISKSKSVTAANAIVRMNEDYMPKGSHKKICTYEEKVSEDTENIFDRDFFKGVDFVVTALDNVEARKYVDSRCIFYQKPSIDSGTLGVKCSTQVVVPHYTESYSSLQDPPEKSIPLCTLKNFPNTIEHTVQWSLNLFEGMFRNSPELAERYRTSEDYLECVLRRHVCKETLNNLLDVLVRDRPESVEQCIIWARNRFEEYFCNQISQLLFNFPADSMTTSGMPFWSGAKKCPEPIRFDCDNPIHMDFIVSASKLKSYVYNLKPDLVDSEYCKKVLEGVTIPEFSPKEGIVIQTNDSEMKENDKEDNHASSSEFYLRNKSDPEVQKIIGSLPASKMSPILNVIGFDKDSNDCSHIDFVASAANLRAINYGISTVTKHTAKGIAGKIIPAIATTTAFVAGLVSLELYKLLDTWPICDMERSQKDASKVIDRFRSSFVNLAIPIFSFSEPMPVVKNRYNDKEWSIWDRFYIKEDVVLHDFMDYFEKEHKLKVSMICYGRSILHGLVSKKSECEERMKMKISELVRHVTKTDIPKHVDVLVLELLVTDCGDEYVDVPYVCVNISG